MSEFVAGFLKGARKAFRAYFAPLVAVWRILVATTKALLGR
jgi:hypothetical protein